LFDVQKYRQTNASMFKIMYGMFCSIMMTSNHVKNSPGRMRKGLVSTRADREFSPLVYHSQVPQIYGCCGIVEKSLDDSSACGAKLFMGSIKQESSTGPPSEPWAYQAGDSSDDDGRKATVTGLCSWVQHIHRTAVRTVHCFDFSVKSTGTGRGLSSSIWLALRRDWLLSVGFTRLMLQTCT
jgi:hypothetical protein